MSVIKFRHKSDLRELPEIPNELQQGLKTLLKDKINADGLTFFERLEAIYSYLDKYNVFVATFSVCSKGCNHCCTNDVLISRLEAEYITYKGGDVLDQGTTITTNNKGRCPFLATNGSCSIYENRPFNCRTLHTLDDPKYCKNGTDTHQIYGSASGGYGVPAYSTLAGWLKKIHQINNQPYRDIRDWFPSKPTLMQQLFKKLS